MTYSLEFLDAIARLDHETPGWHRKIDLGTLSFSSANSDCVLEQVFGDKSSMPLGDGLIRLYGTKWLPAIYLFMCETEPQWRALLAERQAADEFTFATPERLDTIEGVPV